MKTKKYVRASAIGALAAMVFGSFAVADGSGWPKTRWGWFGGHGHDDPQACVRSQRALDRNVRTVISYYTLAFNAGEPELAVEKYVGVDENGDKLYIQHNPFAQDGPDAFIAFLRLRMPRAERAAFESDSGLRSARRGRGAARGRAAAG